MIFLHGFLGSPEDWRPLQDELNVPSKALFLPGHGGSFLPKGFDGVTEKLREEIQKPVTLIGYSLGGRLALHFASQYPHLIKELIILSADPGIANSLKRKNCDKMWATLIQEKGFESFLKAWYEQPFFALFKNSPAFSEAFQRRLLEDPQMMQRILVELSPAVQPSLWKAIENFSFPTLFLFGDRDIKYKSISKKLIQMNSSIQTDFISQAGHAIHLENPKECAQKMKEFL